MFLLELFYTLMSLFPSNFKSDEVNKTHLSFTLQSEDVYVQRMKTRENGLSTSKW